MRLRLHNLMELSHFESQELHVVYDLQSRMTLVGFVMTFFFCVFSLEYFLHFHYLHTPPMELPLTICNFKLKGITITGRVICKYQSFYTVDTRRHWTLSHEYQWCILKFSLPISWKSIIFLFDYSFTCKYQLEKRAWLCIQRNFRK